jgi:hypothetical protein
MSRFSNLVIYNLYCRVTKPAACIGRRVESELLTLPVSELDRNSLIDDHERYGQLSEAALHRNNSRISASRGMYTGNVK